MNEERPNPNKTMIWALADDRAGNVSQCLGVADALGCSYEVKNITYGILAKLPNALFGGSLKGLDKASREIIAPPWPDVVIAAGRRTAPVARYIKKQNKGKTFLIQIMYPGSKGADEFDLIAVPNHDRIPKKLNQLQITGAPHGVTQGKLVQARAVWENRFAHLPKPWTALIVGGTTKNRPFTNEMAQNLGKISNDLAKAHGGSLLVTTSRRTGNAALALTKEISCPSFIYQWGDDGENPYFGFLALADNIVVTGDSVSMVCEACATSASVYIYAPEGYAAPKHAALHEELYQVGYAQPFSEVMQRWERPQLNAAEVIADEIKKRLDII
ncbi:MAG: mitochondrial fission ELM1 family protein [Rhodospirillales bacterium]|nr:mitochondrial fission ELM1 family protein [Rhodospirillales bacterium]